MKKILIRLLSLSLLLSLLISVCSCADEPTNEQEENPVIVEIWGKNLLNSDPSDVTYESSFEKVEDFLNAIKKEPDKYNNANVKIVGTLYERSGEFKLIDLTIASNNIPPNDSGVKERHEWNQRLNNNANIDIYISNEAQYAVAETGDYVKLYGTVRLTKNGIYIDDCEYALIATLDEREQNIENQK